MTAAPSHRYPPARAMVLAAGLGLRMRPITENLPKPLITIAGRTLLERVLDRLAESGIAEVIVNVHHLGHLVEAQLAGRLTPRIRFSRESTLLDTGGGVAQALPLLGSEPFFVINGDVLWRDGPEPPLASLTRCWEPARMDVLLLLQPIATALGYRGAGDFFIKRDRRLIRRGRRLNAPYLFAGLQILSPHLFRERPAVPFSLNLIYDRASASGRLFGVVHEGQWCHVGTPEDIAPAEAFLSGTLPERPAAASKGSCAGSAS